VAGLELPLGLICDNYDGNKTSTIKDLNANKKKKGKGKDTEEEKERQRTKQLNVRLIEC
jgi:hypothetical protein